MGTINSAFQIIAQALNADQEALSVVAGNVANANTTGYTREVANFEETAPVQINGVAYGTGVMETGASSVRDRVLEQRLDQQQQLATGSASRLEALDAVQGLFSPASGSSSSKAGDIGSDITALFSAFSSLVEANPTDDASREQVLSAASTLAGDISSAASSLNSQKSALDQEAAAVTSQVNALTSSIAQLNQQIESTSPSSDAGALEDQRQQDLSQLSQLVGINQIATENNGLSVTTTSGQLLVAEGTSYPLTTGTVTGVTHFYLETTDVTAALAAGGGKLGGYLTARDTDIPAVLASLDQLAYSVSTQVNALNNTGVDLKGTTGTAADPLYLFNEPTTVSGSAVNMKVVMTDPERIAAASPGQGTGDSSNAAAIASLGSQTVVAGQTPITFYASFVTALGSTVAGVQAENTAQNASVTQLQTQCNALSSVNLNDEAASMQQFERSYQAASQVFTMLDSIMASAINLGETTAVS